MNLARVFEASRKKKQQQQQQQKTTLKSVRYGVIIVPLLILAELSRASGAPWVRK